jgi:hypothetical protein
VLGLVADVLKYNKTITKVILRKTTAQASGLLQVEFVLTVSDLIVATAACQFGERKFRPHIASD